MKTLVLPNADLTDIKYYDVSNLLGRKYKFPVVLCYINCDLYSGWVNAVCAPLKICTVLLGNIVRAKLPIFQDTFKPAPEIMNVV